MKTIPLEFLGGRYSISEDGKVVYSHIKNREQTQQKNVCGYYVVHLTPVDKLRYRPRWWSVARLVCMTYNGMPPTNKHEVDHIDMDKENNHYTNLEWVTHSENLLRAHAKKQWGGRSSGFSPSEETRQKMAEKKYKAVFAEVSGVKQYYNSIEELCEKFTPFKMYRKKFNRIMQIGGLYSGWRFGYADRVPDKKEEVKTYKSEEEKVQRVCGDIPKHEFSPEMRPINERYMATSDGRVYDTKRNEYLAFSYIGDTNMPHVSIERNLYSAARVILEAFIGRCPGKTPIHIDGDRGNLNISNLRWGTLSEARGGKSALRVTKKFLNKT